MAAPLTLRFGDIEAGTLPLVGGKAANLGVLTRAGLPVPPGLCITTEAYRRVTDGAGLGEVLAALATGPDPARLNELAARARKLVLAAPVPDDIAQAVRRSATGPVAVRSSATAEDLPDASFAGQQDTYLNVVGADGWRSRRGRPQPGGSTTSSKCSPPSSSHCCRPSCRGPCPGSSCSPWRLDCSATARGPARCRACYAACRTT
jgi:hypothetical protein